MWRKSNAILGNVTFLLQFFVWQSWRVTLWCNIYSLTADTHYVSFQWSQRSPQTPRPSVGQGQHPTWGPWEMSFPLRGSGPLPSFTFCFKATVVQICWFHTFNSAIWFHILLQAGCQLTQSERPSADKIHLYATGLRAAEKPQGVYFTDQTSTTSTWSQIQSLRAEGCLSSISHGARRLSMPLWGLHGCLTFERMYTCGASESTANLILGGTHCI